MEVQSLTIFFFLPKMLQGKKTNTHQANHHMYLLHQNLTSVSNTTDFQDNWGDSMGYKENL